MNQNPNQFFQEVFQHIHMEYGAYFEYFQYSNIANSLGFVAISEWLKEKAEEELEHAHAFIKFLQDVEYSFDMVHCIPHQSTITKREELQSDSIRGILQQLSAGMIISERKVTKSIAYLYDKSTKTVDLVKYSHFFQDFLKEQHEEEVVAAAFNSIMSLVNESMLASMNIEQFKSLVESNH